MELDKKKVLARKCQILFERGLTCKIKNLRMTKININFTHVGF